MDLVHGESFVQTKRELHTSASLIDRSMLGRGKGRKRISMELCLFHLKSLY